jgi:tetratricopeptide (TPR) repeat protein
MPGNKEAFSAAINSADRHRWDSQWTDALQEYQIALTEFPEDATARSGLGFCYMQIKQWQQALSEYQTILQREPDNIIALSKTAELYGILNRREDAYQSYMHLADMYAHIGQAARAEAAWQKAVQLSPDATEPHERLIQYYFEKKDISLLLQERLATAQVYLHRNELNAARTHCEEVLRADGQNIQAQRLLSQITDRSQQILTAGFTTGETGGAATTRSANNDAEQSVVQQSIFDQAASTGQPFTTTSSGNTSGGNTGIMGNMGSAGNYGGMNNQGLSSSMVGNGGMNSAPRQRISASQVTGALQQAQLFQNQGRLNDAIDLCEQILESGFDRPDARYFLGWLYQEQQRWDEAIQQFQLLLNDPDYALSCYYALGQCYRARGDLRTATIHFDEAVDRVNLDALTAEEADQLVQLCQEAAEAHRLLGEQDQALTVYNALLGFLRSRGWEDKVAQVEFMLQQAQSAPQQQGGFPPASGPAINDVPEAPTMEMSADFLNNAMAQPSQPQSAPQPPAPVPAQAAPAPAQQTSGELPDWLTGILDEKPATQNTPPASKPATPPPAAPEPQTPAPADFTMMVDASDASASWLTDGAKPEPAAPPAEPAPQPTPAAPAPQPAAPAPAPTPVVPQAPVQQAQPVAPPAPAAPAPQAAAPAPAPQAAAPAPAPTPVVPQAPAPAPAPTPVAPPPMEAIPNPVPMQYPDAVSPAARQASDAQLIVPSASPEARQQEKSFEELLNQMIDGRGNGLNHVADAVLTSTAVLPEGIRTQVVRAMQDIHNYVNHGLLTPAIDECLKVIDMAPQYLDVHQVLCEIYVRQGKVEQAITKYGILVDTYIVNGRTEDAVATYRRILQLDPNNLTYRMRLIDLLTTHGNKEDLLRERTLAAESYLRLGYMDRAMTELEQALKESPTSVPTRLNYALALQKLGRIQPAVAEYQRVLQIDPRNITALVRWHLAMITTLGTARSTSLELLTRILWQLRGEGQKHVGTIIRDYAQNAESYPNTADIHFALGQIYDQSGQFDRAIDEYTLAIRDSSVEILARVSAAHVFLAQGKPEAAISQFEQALQHVRRSPHAMDPATWAARPREEGEEHQAPEVEISLQLAKAYGRTGRQDQMNAIMQQIRQIRPTHDEVSSSIAEISSRQTDINSALQEYIDLVRHYRQNKQFDNALNVLNEMVRMAPQDARAHSELADIYITRGLLEEGMAELRLLADIYLRNSKLELAGEAIQRIGNLYAEMGDTEEALANLKRAVELNPEAMDLLREVVGLCMQLGRSQDAVRYQTQIARYYFDTQQVKEAVASLQQLIAIDRTSYEAYDMLGQTYQSVGEFEQASRVYRNRAKVNPGSTIARERLATLQDLRAH